jgi:hypothetical protein
VSQVSEVHIIPRTSNVKLELSYQSAQTHTSSKLLARCSTAMRPAGCTRSITCAAAAAAAQLHAHVYRCVQQTSVCTDHARVTVHQGLRWMEK